MIVIPRRLSFVVRTLAMLFCLCLAAGAPVRAAEGKRLPAIPSAERSAAGYRPEMAVDENEDTLWIANLAVSAANNHTWFQLDLGSVKPVARLHWIAAQNTPYPASAPAEYHVLVSKNGQQWTPVAVPSSKGINPQGSVLLNVDARYIRLETSKVNDGTGWSLGLREIWATEGRDNSAVTLAFRPVVQPANGSVTLTWNLPPGIRPARIAVYRSEAPEAPRGAPLAVLPGNSREYKDQIPNWTLRYYHLEALDAGRKSLLTSDLAAAVARPAAQVAPVETFAFWYEPYKPSTDPDASIKHIGDAAFVVGPGFEAAADLAKVGKGLLPYVTFYQTSGWAGTFSQDADPAVVIKKIAPVAFYRKSLHFPGCPPGYAPTVFCRPGNVEYNPRSVQYTTCPNSAPFREMVLAHVRKQLDGGVLGFFVDNGYEDDVAARSVCESTAHAHYYGAHLTSADAFLGMLLEVTCEVKKRHPNGVVMVNGGVPGGANFYGLSLGDVCDGTLWESYLRTSYSTLKEHVEEWQGVYTRSVELEKAWSQEPPARMFVLSYPWNREEAYFCYATAKLCNLPWSASLGVSDPDHKQFGGHFGTYPELIDLRLGRPTNQGQYGGTKTGEVYYREYARGLVIVNPTKTAQTAAIPLGPIRSYRDVFAGTNGQGAALSVSLPPESGRVFLWSPAR